MERTIEKKIEKLKSLDCGYCSVTDIVDVFVPEFNMNRLSYFRNELIDLLERSSPDNWDTVSLEEEYGLIPLPGDREGNPIHIGDTVYDLDGNEWSVFGLRIGEGYVMVRKDGCDDKTYLTIHLTHRPPITVESVLQGFAKMCHDGCDTPENIAAYAKRLRLTEEGECEMFERRSENVFI